MTASEPLDHRPSKSPGNARRGLRFGDFLSRAFRAYGRHWREWFRPMTICAMFGLTVALLAGGGFVIARWILGFDTSTAAGVAVACGAALVFLAKGPLACGLYACALKNYRDPPLDAGPMRRGLETLPASVTAGILLMLFQRVPPLLVAGAIYAVTQWVSALMRQPGADRGDVLLSAGWMALSMVILLAGFAWGLWISTRTMFVVPLIADRGLRFNAALRESWRTTRSRFWELFLVRFLAYVVANLGAYVAIAGILLSMPVYFLVVMAVYEDRFSASGSAPEDQK